MIRGSVNARHDMVIPVPVLDADGNEQRIDALIDSGFSGPLSVPPSLFMTLGLLPAGTVRFTRADGSDVDVHYADAVVVGNGQRQHTWIFCLDVPPLVGLTLLAGHDLRARLEDGGVVEIEKIP